nr:unnamed protein product [Callosobruchus chinensis]
MTTEKLFEEEKVSHHTFSLSSERTIHAIEGFPHHFQNKSYSPHHIIHLKRSGVMLMPLAVVMLPKVEKSQQVFNKYMNH